jgi:tetratricopeptide (TPR) repeat protein
VAKRRLAFLPLLFLPALPVIACGWSPSRPFDRESPEVNQAIVALDGGDATVAAKTLEDYLSTGPCADSNIGAPELLKKRPNGTFDLGLSLFKLGEAYGRRFGEEEDGTSPATPGGGQPQAAAGNDEKQKGLRAEQVGCAVRILGAIANDLNVPVDLRARARYLEGNLNFLDGHYKEAVAAYDKALTLAPGENDGGDPVGRDAAWNRAIAEKRIDDQKDSGQDSGNDGGNDSGKEGGADSGNDGGNDGGGDSGGGGNDSGNDSGQSPDTGSPDAGQPPPPEPQPDAGPPPPPRANEDDRMLDQLENAPTVQQEDAKKKAAHRKVRGMADK